MIERIRAGEVLLMDGAMGSELQRAGLEAGSCGEAWNLSHPERVRDIHQAYVDAGAECILTNTFLASPHHLKRHGLSGRLADINRAAVSLARAAAGPARFVLADIGPLCEAGGAWCHDWLRRLLPSHYGVDGILLETFSDEAAFDVAHGIRHSELTPPNMPVLLSFAYMHRSPHPFPSPAGGEGAGVRGAGGLTTFGGQTPEEIARQAASCGISALGVNCGRDITMTDTIEIIRRYRASTELPLFARPNAGTPTRAESGWIYPHSPAAMAAQVGELIAAGASMLGGCCGTTPEHIRAFRQVIDGIRK